MTLEMSCGRSAVDVHRNLQKCSVLSRPLVTQTRLLLCSSQNPSIMGGMVHINRSLNIYVLVGSGQELLTEASAAAFIIDSID